MSDDSRDAGDLTLPEHGPEHGIDPDAPELALAGLSDARARRDGRRDHRASCDRSGSEDDLGEVAQRVAGGLRRSPVSPITISMLARGFDLTATGLGLWFAAYAAMPVPFASRQAVIVALVAAIFSVIASDLMGAYRLRALKSMGRGALRLAGLGAGLGLLAWSVGAWGPRTSAFIPSVFVALGLTAIASRAVMAILASWALDFGLTQRRAMVVGGGANAAKLIRGLAANPENDIRVCGIFDDRDDARSPAAVMGVPKIGRVRELVSFARSAEIDILIVTLPLSAEKRIREVMSHVRVLPIDVRLSAYSSAYSFPRRDAAETGEPGLIDVMRRPLAGVGRIRKRAFDLVVASTALLVLSPVMLFVALAIRLESRGPVIFRQMRHGYNHRSVEVWKFRSMYNASRDLTARKVVTRDDPRVTRVGRFIRRTSLDELPQLINVIRGDLSLVGPRPHVLDAVSSQQQAFAEIVEDYAARHKMPPGVTGWAQIHGWRGEIDDPEKLQKRFEHDLYYIENWSIWLDLYVLAMTPLRLLDTRNAY